ncbi:hypothetical protein FJM65_10965 [Pontibacter mangrovi]|uniref:Glycosyl hydrolase family 95 N-terminal domain-containing protein n=1 Tax=Pontibacter mangrovi TaxID=2589816 RepID=A0A501WAV4_9BACT|nr:glycoside hydrolase N-terminal domain-containing protein [Pontibacter mangrovi]TPE43937.1 hypothetical protein FJM65_10965 [Pontibacter mangrovi]
MVRQDWMREALPIGNGYMGVMFFGGVGEERLQFSEESLWSGGPHSNPKYNYGNKPEAWRYLPEIRQLIKDGKLQEANQLVQRHLTRTAPAKLEGGTDWGDYGAQQTMGDLYVQLAHGRYRAAAGAARSMAGGTGKGAAGQRRVHAGHAVGRRQTGAGKYKGRQRRHLPPRLPGQAAGLACAGRQRDTRQSERF